MTPEEGADRCPTASSRWLGSRGTRCSGGLCSRCHPPSSPRGPAARVPCAPLRPAPQPRAPPESAAGSTLETTPGPLGAPRPAGTGGKASETVRAVWRGAGQGGRCLSEGVGGATPLWRRKYSQCRPQAQGGRVLPSGNESVGEPRVEEGGERLPLGSTGVGLELGGGPLGKQGTPQRCPPAEMPLESLGSGEFSARKGGTWDRPTLGTPTRSLRGRQGRSPMGPTTAIYEGLPRALTPSRAIPRGRLSCRCSAAHASLKRGLSSHLSSRKRLWRGLGRGGGGAGGAGHGKESSRPHSTCLTPLTSPAHPAEVLPPARAQGPGLPCRCRPRSRRNCSLEDRRHRPRCRCRRPRWKSSRTWGQVGGIR